MYICICNAVTDKQIRRAAAGGVDSLYALRENLGVATGCGSCASYVQDILDESAGRKGQPTIYTPAPE